MKRPPTSFVYLLPPLDYLQYYLQTRYDAYFSSFSTPYTLHYFAFPPSLRSQHNLVPPNFLFVVSSSCRRLMSNKKSLYVGGLGPSVTSDLVRAAFIPFGDLRDVDMPMDYKTNTPKGEWE